MDEKGKDVTTWVDRDVIRQLLGIMQVRALTKDESLLFESLTEKSIRRDKWKWFFLNLTSYISSATLLIISLLDKLS